MSITQFEYYQQQKMHPDNLSVDDVMTLNKHYEMRINLYQNLLRLPVSLFSGKEVLELGCGTGENALVLALNNAKLTLLDADHNVEPHINTLFNRFNVTRQIQKIVFCNIDKFDVSMTFDLVTAEGFINNMNNRNEILIKICHFIKNGGFGIISFPERFGAFLEFIKKTVVWRMYQLSNIDNIFSNDALIIAKELLENNYKRLPQTRNFEVWWKDCIVSPFLTYNDCWDYKEILDLIGKHGCIFYSSIPRIYEPDHLEWYKKLQSSNERYGSIISNYTLRRFDFLFGEEMNITCKDENIIQKLIHEINNIINILSVYFRHIGQLVPKINFGPTAKLFEDVGIKHDIVHELIHFFDLLQSATSIELHEGYKKLKKLNNTWGKTYHYLCFIKEKPFLMNS